LCYNERGMLCRFLSQIDFKLSQFINKTNGIRRFATLPYSVRQVSVVKYSRRGAIFKDRYKLREKQISSRDE